MDEVIFKADREFEQYLRAIGFTNVQAVSNKIYLVNKLGRQVKIDPESNNITLLDEGGFVLDKSHEFLITRINNFSNGN